MTEPRRWAHTFAIATNAANALYTVGRTHSLVHKLVVSRYTTAGILDSTFGTVGTYTQLLGQSSGLHGVIVQTSDSRPVVCGYTCTAAGNTSALIMRLTTAGALDTSFATIGYTLLKPFTGATFTDVVLNGSGQAIAAGISNSSGINSILIARYTTAGVLDTTWNTIGYTVTSFGTSVAVTGVAIDASNRPIVCGTVYGNATGRIFIARYTTTGIIDTTFGTSGFTTVTIGSDDRATSIFRTSAGAHLVSGITDRQAVVLRFTTAGVLDTTFNTVGYNIPNIPSLTSTIDSGYNAVIELSGGQVFAVGYASQQNVQQSLVSQFLSTGALDTGYQTTGVVVTNIAAQPRAMAVVQVGTATIVAGYSRYGTWAINYSSTGALTTAYAQSGISNQAISNVDSTGLPYVQFSADGPNTVGAAGILQGYSTLTDTANRFVPTTGIYTVPVRGIYQVSGQATVRSSLVAASVSPVISIRVNGVIATSSSNTLALSILNILSFTLVSNMTIALNAGDTVSLHLTGLVSLSLDTSDGTLSNLCASLMSLQ